MPTEEVFVAVGPGEFTLDLEVGAWEAFYVDRDLT